MKKLLSIYNEAPPIGKILLIAAGIVLAYFIYKTLTKVLAPVPTNEQLTTSAIDEIKTLATQGETTHYSVSQINAFADKLFTAMDGQGTNEAQIGEVFNYMQNKADVLELIKAFGIRSYEDGLFVSYDYNLSQWLNTEMDVAELNQYVNSPLKSKSIDYKF